jgi:hypothetical protein
VAIFGEATLKKRPNRGWNLRGERDQSGSIFSTFASVLKTSSPSNGTIARQHLEQ